MAASITRTGPTILGLVRRGIGLLKIREAIGTLRRLLRSSDVYPITIICLKKLHTYNIIASRMLLTAC